jgi:hypothetical protein
MKTSMRKLAVFGLLTAAIVITPTRGFSEDKKDDKPAAGATEPAKPKSDIAPFRGKVSAVDKAAMTFTVGERTFQVNSETKITKGGKPATLGDAAVGDEVGGRYKKTEDGKLVTLSVRFGPKPEGEEKPEKEAK